MYSSLTESVFDKGLGKIGWPGNWVCVRACFSWFVAPGWLKPCGVVLSHVGLVGGWPLKRVGRVLKA